MNDSQLSLEVSRANWAGPRDAAKVAELRKAGRWVVAFGYDHHCPITDAFIGVEVQLFADFATEQEACNYVYRRWPGNAGLEVRDEIVWGPIVPRAEPVAVDNSDIPF